MNPKRTSIAGLMGWIVVTAVGLVALKKSSTIWSSVCFTAMFVTLGLGLFRAAFGEGRSRTFWAGFSLAGWVYLLATYMVLGRYDQADPPLLLTRFALLQALSYTHPESVGFLPYLTSDGKSTPGPVLVPIGNGPIIPAAPLPSLVPIDPANAGPPGPADPEPVTAVVPSPVLAAPSAPQIQVPSNLVVAPVIQGPFLVAGSDATICFEQIGQSLWTLLLGYVGGRYATRLRSRREPAVIPSSP